MDAVPGMPTQFKFTATKTTQQMREELGNPNFNYELACAEICGRGHFSMKMSVVVEDEESYEKWKASQEAWLKQNPDYLKKVPEALKEAAMIKAGMVKDPGPTYTLITTSTITMIMTMNMSITKEIFGRTTFLVRITK
jgi:cytochrome c oxidase subunit 2